MNSSGAAPVPPSLPSTDDEVGIDAGLQHRLADRQEFPGVADAQLEAGRLAARTAAASRR
jgi:hypothetical protein